MMGFNHPISYISDMQQNHRESKSEVRPSSVALFAKRGGWQVNTPSLLLFRGAHDRGSSFRT